MTPAGIEPAAFWFVAQHLNHCATVRVCLALGIQHAMRMRHIAIMAIPAVQYFSTLSHKRHDFFLSDWTPNLCFYILYIFFSEIFLVYGELSEIWPKMYIGLHVKCPLFLSDINKTWVFKTDFLKIHKNKISWKSVQWEPSCFMRTDRHEDANRLIF